MKVLVGCEFSQTVTSSFIEAGYDAWSCDLLPAEGKYPQKHLQCDVLSVLDKDWDLAVFHPTCTYLSNSGVRHLHEHVTSNKGNKAKISGAARWVELEKGCDFFLKLWNCNIPRICIENPVPHKYAKAKIGEYTQLIQPWQFGEKTSKATCLWLKNPPKLIPTKIVGPPPKNMTPEEKRKWYPIHYMSPSADRGKKRSVFFKGVSNAMAQQWGSL